MLLRKIDDCKTRVQSMRGREFRPHPRQTDESPVVSPLRTLTFAWKASVCGASNSSMIAEVNGVFQEYPCMWRHQRQMSLLASQVSFFTARSNVRKESAHVRNRRPQC